MGNSSPASSDSSKVSSSKKEQDASQSGKKSKRGGLVSYSYTPTPTPDKGAQTLSNNGKRSLDNSLSGKRGSSINGKRCLDRSQSGLRESIGNSQSTPKNREHSTSPVLVTAAGVAFEKLDLGCLVTTVEPIE